MLKEDDFETTTVGILKEKYKNKEHKLKEVSESQITQIFLFFDFDGHSWEDKKQRHNNIIELLSFFDNETEQGKLYISYPMAESIKDFQKSFSCLKSCKSEIDLGKKNIKN